ncbi:sulfatase family protein [Luteolibacter luteus]|uniref:Sulfatase n=1 Tax=Luteolibacter luteus TaxID=2728835 RepID=A0A858RCS8_9BACT|nr:sulfatase [Luteolibacter luteus]QJE94451.1 sulfatase [Luteolibacter luteus]
MRIFALLFLAGLSFPALAEETKLNVLLITADDMNADSPGWMGNPLQPTPNIDRFASVSHRFTNHHVSAPICQPSRAAIMTGRVPHRSGGLGFNPINKDVPTLATVLKENGYYIAALNKIAHMKPDSAFPWDAKFDGSAKNPGQLGTQVSQAIATAKTEGKPFFINCNIGDPHRPFYGAAPNRKQQLKQKQRPESPGAVAKPFKAEDVKVPAFLEDLPDIREEYAQYSNSVQRLDLSFGKVLAALEDSGLAANTVVLFLSDHGISMPFSKATVFYNGTWSPVLLKLPSGPEATRHTELVSSVDILPTLLELVKIPAPQGIDGVSWLPLLAGESQPGRDKVFTHVNGVSSGKQFPQRAVNTRARSLIFLPWSGSQPLRVEAMQGLTYPALDEAAASHPEIRARLDQYIKGSPLALYDLEKDPAQRRNVIDDPAYASDRKELVEALVAQMEKTGDPQLAAFRTILTPKP